MIYFMTAILQFLLDMQVFGNAFTARGILRDLPQFSHENHGRKFYRFLLDIPRLSGTIDTLPVIIRDDTLNCLDLSSGDKLTVHGQIRSHNTRENGNRRLLIFVYAESIAAEDGDFINDCILEGPVCREPLFRRTPLGREICDVMLAVTRSFRRADYLPCILWGRTAQEISACHTRDRVRICGRLQSRCYTKLTNEGPQERTAYEISGLTADILDEII